MCEPFSWAEKLQISLVLNPLTPNDPYGDRTAPLTSKRCILYIYSTNIGIEYFKHGIYSPTIILPVVLCGCETWSLTLREERKLRVFENMVLRRIF